MAAEGDSATFVHFWKIGLGAGGHTRLVEQLVTAKGHAVHEFTLKLISMMDDFPYLGRRNTPNQPSPYQLVLEPSLRSYSIRTPMMKACKFDMVIKKPSGEVIMGPYNYECNPKFELHDPSVRVPSESPLAVALPIAMALKTPNVYMMITTTLVIPLSIFKIGRWPLAARPIPVNKDFTFAVINNKAKHDLRLLCNGGVYSANKAALFQCSLYFRRQFGDRRNAIEFVEEASFQAVEIVMTFMFTGTFLAPASITPSLISDIYGLIRRYHVMGPKELLHALEKEASLQLIKEDEDLEKVLLWLITANECEMSRLENTANAILLTKHANQVLADYTGETPGNAERRDIFERLHRQRNLFHLQPIARFTHHKQRKLMEFQSVEI